MKTSCFERALVNEIRCKKCRRLLMKGDVRRIEIKCPKCGHVQRIEEKEGYEIEQKEQYCGDRAVTR